MAFTRISRSFKDISLSFEPHPVTKDLPVLKNERAIIRSVRNIVETIPTEKFFNPLFGSDVYRSLFDFVDFGTASIIQEQIKTSFRDAGLPQAPSTQASVSLEKSEDEHEFASEKCEACKVRLGISGIHCILCGCLYHEACAAKQKGDKTAICKFCLKA